MDNEKIPAAGQSWRLVPYRNALLESGRSMSAEGRVGTGWRLCAAKGYYFPPSTLPGAEAASGIALLARAVWIWVFKRSPLPP